MTVDLPPCPDTCINVSFMKLLVGWGVTALEYFANTVIYLFIFKYVYLLVFAKVFLIFAN